MKNKILYILKSNITETANDYDKIYEKDFDKVANELLAAISDRRCCTELPKTNCTLNRQTCEKGSGCKYPHCHL